MVLLSKTTGKDSMLHTMTLEAAVDAIETRFGGLRTSPTHTPLSSALHQVLAEDVASGEDVPSFDRSTVDGYALRARDTFGCSQGIPAFERCVGTIKMGTMASESCGDGECFDIPTGGALPPGSDAVVMVEQTEIYGDGTIGILKPVAPGDNVVFRGDDIRTGQTILSAGTILLPHHIGALSALGVESVVVHELVRVGIISSGDEIVPPSQFLLQGQMRDVNSPLLAAAVQDSGGTPHSLGIVHDNPDELDATVTEALQTCQLVLISGGSSAGVHDNSLDIIGRHAEVLLHGIAMKPGKPTIVGDAHGVPLIGLPGHPIAAYFVFLLLIKPLIASMRGTSVTEHRLTATLQESVPSNQGRAEYVAVRLGEPLSEDTIAPAYPMHIKSGLISLLTTTDGYFCIPRDQEGVSAGTQVIVTLYR
jgi:molybdopterin molybdotransferase